METMTNGDSIYGHAKKNTIYDLLVWYMVLTRLDIVKFGGDIL